MAETVKKPVLVIMAAGMGSRYGGLKQIDPVDRDGHIIMDFSLYDARQAGFEDAVFIIKRENEADFREAIGDRISKYMNVTYCFQELTDIPAGYQIPEGREKPWGTAHAVYSCRGAVNGPFAVINADDFYGREAFCLLYDYLTTHSDDDLYRYAMVGYRLANTVTENGYVSRGVCSVSPEGELTGITERTRIEKRPEGIAFTLDDGERWQPLADDTVVSMNMWGFTHSMMKEIEAGLPEFLDSGLKENPLKCEYYLPAAASRLVEEHKATVQMLHSQDKWYGITYKEDKPMLEDAVEKMKSRGDYPARLW